jgi:hypothetical protein
MNDEGQAGQERSASGVVWVWLCGLTVVVMLYVLGSGPVGMLEDKEILKSSNPVCKFVDGLYKPLIWVYIHTPLRQPLGMYWHLWAPDSFNSKGNIYSKQ